MTRALPFLLTTALRLAIWLLLTADPGVTNVALGLVLALLLPRASSRGLPLRELFGALGRTLAAVPRAWLEAAALVTAERLEEGEEEQPARRADVPLLVFLEVFRITLTPFTIVLGVENDGRHYRIHTLRPQRRRGPAARRMPAPENGGAGR